MSVQVLYERTLSNMCRHIAHPAYDTWSESMYLVVKWMYELKWKRFSTMYSYQHQKLLATSWKFIILEVIMHGSPCDKSSTLCYAVYMEFTPFCSKSICLELHSRLNMVADVAVRWWTVKYNLWYYSLNNFLEIYFFRFSLLHMILY